MNLKHEFGDGNGAKYANLQFSGQADKYEQLRARSVLFTGGLYPIASGKSLFVRIDTPSLRPIAEEFDGQREKIVTGLKAVGRLAEWFEQNSVELERTFKSNEPREESLTKKFETALRALAANFLSWREHLVALTARARVPAIFHDREFPLSYACVLLIGLGFLMKVVPVLAPLQSHIHTVLWSNLFLFPVVGLLLGYFLLPVISGAFKSVYGRELLLGGYFCEIVSSSVPNADSNVTIVTLPPNSSRGMRHGLYNQDAAPELIAAFIKKHVS